MNFDTWSILFSLSFSIVGLGYISYGKKENEVSFMVAGAVLLIYPYLIYNIWLLVGIGIAVCVLPFIFRF